MNKVKENLIQYMEGMSIIDAHEHLWPEESVLSGEGLDLMGVLMSHYIALSLNSSGLNVSREWLNDCSVPLAQRWAVLSPHLPYIRYTGFFRTAECSLQALFGIDRLDDSTYEVANERVRQMLRPGLYDKILKDHCKIERVLNQYLWDQEHGYDDFYTEINTEPLELQYCRTELGFTPEDDNFKILWDKYGNGDENIDEFTEQWIHRAAGNHHGIKIMGNVPFPCPSFSEAEKQFQFYKKNLDDSPPRDLICLYFLHKIIELAGEYGLVVAVHCGIDWICSTDYYQYAIKNIYEVVMTYKDTVFDIYHAGVPWVREAGAMGNQCPNANLNLTWIHEISPAMTQSFLDEWIDLVPLNKIIGFGADSSTPFLTAGVRKLTFDNIAEVLSRRVERGDMGADEACDICDLWLCQNPKKIYRL